MGKFSEYRSNLKIWLAGFADTRYARLVVFLHSFIDSSVFPLTVDISLLPVSIAKPKRAFQFALWASIGSALGASLAFIIGYEFMETLGFALLDFLNYHDQWDKAVESFRGELASISIAIAALTPVSFTLAAIAAGAVKMSFVNFIVVVLIFRTARFIILAILIYYLGEQVKHFFDNYYSMIVKIFFTILVAVVLFLIFI